MISIFTICSNNYLAQASVLAASVAQHCPEVRFEVYLVDLPFAEIKYEDLPFNVVFINEIENDIEELLTRYDIIELNTCVKPKIFQHICSDPEITQAVYLDPDIKLFDALTNLYIAFEQYSILLTPHILTPIPIDDKWPLEQQFLNYGLYNLGFIGIKNDTTGRGFLAWWKERTYKLGYSRVAEGLFVDQLPVNFAPIFFDRVHVLKDLGYNMGPWNLHERMLTVVAGHIMVNEKTSLKFFHFSSFKINSGELPLHYYSRFTLNDRLDLREIYQQYNNDLISADYAKYSSIPCAYVSRRQELQTSLEGKSQNAPSFLTKCLRTSVRLLPSSVRLKLKDLFMHTT